MPGAGGRLSVCREEYLGHAESQAVSERARESADIRHRDGARQTIVKPFVESP